MEEDEEEAPPARLPTRACYLTIKTTMKVTTMMPGDTASPASASAVFVPCREAEVLRWAEAQLYRRAGKHMGQLQHN